MPTIRQKKLAKKLLENPTLSVSAAMKEVGYSPETAKVPSDVTRSKGWQTLIDKYLPDARLLERHAEGLDATKIHTSHTEPDRVVPDFSVRKQYVELGYKVKGKLGPETQVNNQYNGDLNVSFTTEDRQA